MNRLLSKPAWLIVIGVMVLLLVGSGLALLYLAKGSVINQALPIAQSLGYTDPALLVAYSSCWEVDSQCGDWVLYTTTESSAQFQARMTQLRWAPLVAPNSSVLFDDSSLGKTHYLTADGTTNDHLGNRVPDEKLPLAWEWWTTLANGKKVYVTFYETQRSQTIYTFDARRIKGNIVEVLYRTR